MTIVTRAHAPRQVFERWYQHKCLAAVEDPMDVLYGTTHTNVYYWFAQVFAPAMLPRGGASAWLRGSWQLSGPACRRRSSG